MSTKHESSSGRLLFMQWLSSLIFRSQLRGLNLFFASSGHCFSGCGDCDYLGGFFAMTFVVGHVVALIADRSLVICPRRLTSKPFSNACRARRWMVGHSCSVAQSTLEIRRGFILNDLFFCQCDLIREERRKKCQGKEKRTRRSDQRNYERDFATNCFSLRWSVCWIFGEILVDVRNDPSTFVGLWGVDVCWSCCRLILDLEKSTNESRKLSVIHLRVAVQVGFVDHRVQFVISQLFA